MGVLPAAIPSMLEIVASLSKEPRSPGSYGSLAARGLIARILELIGYTTEEHHTLTRGWALRGQPSIRVVGEQGEEIPALPAVLSPPTPDAGLTGTVVPADPIFMLDTFQWPRLAVIGEDGSPLAYILSSQKEVKVQPLPDNSQDLPHVTLEFPAFSSLRDTALRAPGTRVLVRNPTLLSDSCLLRSILTVSDIASPRQVLVCAHYDSIYDSPGALDNASGVAVALHLAHWSIREKLPCRFAFFDGEEINKAGSTAYAASLGDSAMSAYSHILEIDTLGAGNEIAFLCSKKLWKYVRQVPVHECVPDTFRVTMSGQPRISFSDVWPFMERGLPVVRMLTRGPVAAGLANDAIHTSQDTIEKISPPTLDASYLAATVLLEHLCK